MAQLSALTRLYHKISDHLSDEEVRSLRTMLVPDIFGVARVQHATALEIFKMLQADNKIGNGNLELLVEILQSLGKGRLAEEAEQLEQEQKTEAQAATAAVHQANPMSEAHRTILLRNYPTIYQDLDATRVLDYLHEHRVITEEMRQEILTIPEDQRHQRTRRLLDHILQSGDEAFITFRTALGHAGYPHLVELLTGGQQQLMPQFWLQFPEFWLQFPEFWLQFPEFWLQFQEFWLQFPEFYRIGLIPMGGDLSTTLSELLLTEEMRGLEGGDQLVVKTLVLEQDVTVWRNFYRKGDPQPQDEQVEQVTSQLASPDTSRQTEELQVRQNKSGGPHGTKAMTTRCSCRPCDVPEHPAQRGEVGQSRSSTGCRDQGEPHNKRRRQEEGNGMEPDLQQRHHVQPISRCYNRCYNQTKPDAC
ncbi:Hypp7217 [Branchiostoma lanceolatum]|uniref:Hypp7217 protein n=1 Tax=Branchiostoma lanceolatum TaxID=7740 RepID=A0A8K0EAG6_BRALA|nr:Hypp7217 [Branchiostoma lanceolatum]